MEAPMPQTETERKPVRFSLDPKRHYLLRQLAAKAEQSMSRYLQALVDRELDREAKKLAG